MKKRIVLSILLAITASACVLDADDAGDEVLGDLDLWVSEGPDGGLVEVESAGPDGVIMPPLCPWAPWCPPLPLPPCPFPGHPGEGTTCRGPNGPVMPPTWPGSIDQDGKMGMPAEPPPTDEPGPTDTTGAAPYVVIICGPGAGYPCPQWPTPPTTCIFTKGPDGKWVATCTVDGIGTSPSPEEDGKMGSPDPVQEPNVNTGTSSGGG